MLACGTVDDASCGGDGARGTEDASVSPHEGLTEAAVRLFILMTRCVLRD